MKNLRVLTCVIFMFLLASFASAQNTSNTTWIQMDNVGGYFDNQGVFHMSQMVKDLESVGFVDGMSWYRKGDKYGYIDIYGNIAIKPTYKFASNFSCGKFGHAVVKKGKKSWHVIDKNNKIVLSAEAFILPGNGRFYVLSVSQFGFSTDIYDLDGNKVKTIPGLLTPSLFNKDTTTLSSYAGKEPFYLVDKDGNKLSSHSYTGMPHPNEGVVVCKEKSGSVIIDYFGRMTFSLKDTDITGYSAFLEGLCAIRKGGKYGFIDKVGHWVIPATYDTVYGFFDGMCMVVKDKKTGVIGTDGNFIVSPVYEAMSCGAWFDYQYDAKRKITPFCDGLCCVQKEGKWGYINMKGETVIPFIYDYATPFCNGIAAVTTVKDGKRTKKAINVYGEEVHTRADVKVYEERGATITLDWNNFPAVAKQRSIELDVAVSSDSRVVYDEVWLNGSKLRAPMVVPDDGNSLHIRQQLQLADGENVVRVVVESTSGKVEESRRITYNVPVKPVVERRIALVMGNAAYGAEKTLNNPINDARAVALKLQDLGFTVETAENANREQMEQKIIDFGKKAKGYDVVMFYYSGHGYGQDGSNYLIPIGARVEDKMHVKSRCVDVAWVLEKMEEADCNVKILVLDACRSNFRTFKGAGDSFVTTSAPKGTIMAFSTSPGQPALDGMPGEKHSPYADAFLKALDKKGISISEFFTNVNAMLNAKTRGQQTAWSSSSLTGNFIFNK